MSRLLVPLDGSPASDRALKHVAAMVKQGADSEIHLLHVQPPLVPQDVPTIAKPGLAPRLAAEDVDHAFSTARRELEKAGLRYTAYTSSGDAAQEIAFHADVHGCDGIVMGTRGLGPVKNLLIGSVATKVLHL